MMKMNLNKTKKLNKKYDTLWIVYLWITALIVLFGIVFNLNRAYAQNLISVKDKAVVVGEKIFLKDIAETDNPGLKEIFIGKSPKPSKSINISGYKIASILRRSNIPDNVTFEVPEVVTVSRDFQIIKALDVEEFLKEVLKKKLENISFDISGFKLKGKVKYPNGSLTFKPNFRGKLSGRTSLPIDVDVNGSFYGKVRAHFWINRFDSAVFANKNLRKNSIILESDLVVQRINISKYRGDYISNIDEVTGKKVKRSFRKGSVVKPGSIEKAPLITKGSLVRLVATSGNLVVETIGKAQNDGFEGGTILVLNISSKKIITGKVVNKSTVSAFF